MIVTLAESFLINSLIECLLPTFAMHSMDISDSAFSWRKLKSDQKVYFPVYWKQLHLINLGMVPNAFTNKKLGILLYQ